MDDHDPIEAAIENASQWEQKADPFIRTYCGISKSLRGADAQLRTTELYRGATELVHIAYQKIVKIRQDAITYAVVDLNDSRARALVEPEVISVAEAVNQLYIYCPGG